MLLKSVYRFKNTFKYFIGEKKTFCKILKNAFDIPVIHITFILKS